MKTVSNLLAASLCLGMSASVYAQGSAAQPAKRAAPMADAAKAKVVKHTVAAPAETSAMSPKKNTTSLEHTAKTVPPTAAATKADKVDTSHAKLQKVETSAKDHGLTHNEIKPAAKISKPSVEAPKVVK